MNVSRGRHAGFTLIELMITVAIIAILAGIALQAYVAHVARAQVTAGLDEIRGGKTSLELAINDGRASDVDASFIGLQGSTKRCSVITATAEGTGAASIQCTLIGNPEVVGKSILLARSSSGFWSCDASELPEGFRPEGCG